MTPRDPAAAMVVERDIPITMDDGLVIRADVYRPETQEPVPVIMTCGPYGKGGEIPRSLQADVGLVGRTTS